MLDYISHFVFDAFLVFRWLFEVVKFLFYSLWQPVSFAYNFFLSFFDKINTPITYEPSISFGSSTVAVLEALPYWSTIQLLVGTGLIIISGFFIFKILTE